MAVIVSTDDDISKSDPWINVINASSTSNTHTSGQDNNDSFFITYKGKPTILKEKGKEEMSWSFSKPMNFNSLNILRFAIREVIIKAKVEMIKPPIPILYSFWSIPITIH